MRERYIKARNFVRRVLGLRAVAVKFARPTPTCVPGLAEDLTRPGPASANARLARIEARVRPVAANLAAAHATWPGI